MDRVNQALSVVVREVVPKALAEENAHLKKVLNQYLLHCDRCQEYWPKRLGSFDCQQCGEHLCKDRQLECACKDKCTRCVVGGQCPDCAVKLCPDCGLICGLCGRGFCIWDFPDHDCSG